MGMLGEKNDGISPEMNRELSSDINKAEEGVVAAEEHVDLHRDLKARHITMIGMPLLLLCGFLLFSKKRN
jgi:amino acid transporter